MKNIKSLFNSKKPFEFLEDISDKNEKLKSALIRLKDVDELIEENNFKSLIEFDLSLARGFDYYTGIVFEAIVIDENENKVGGSIAGGGRYDKLVGLFGNRDTPCIGYGIGVDRTIEALIDLENDEIKSISDSPLAHMIVYLKNSKLRNEAFKLLSKLHQENINVTMTVDEYDSWGKMFKKEFKFADKKGAKFGIIIDEKSLKEGKYILKNLKKREQVELSEEEILSKLKKNVDKNIF